jgi:2-polyprenyl-3-methyl-5-hydroxy-6-metoxy-1,4-benzoquinol methylase
LVVKTRASREAYAAARPVLSTRWTCALITNATKKKHDWLADRRSWNSSGPKIFWRGTCRRHRRAVLDVGGAAGVYSLWLASLGHEVHLVDASGRLVEEAKRRSALAAKPIRSMRVGKRVRAGRSVGERLMWSW